MAAVCAACPDAKATASTPPSKLAMRASKAPVVGLVRRVYIGPASERVRRFAACSADSKTKEVVWWMGTLRELEDPSKSCPTCRARVSRDQFSKLLLSYFVIPGTVPVGHGSFHLWNGTCRQCENINRQSGIVLRSKRSRKTSCHAHATHPDMVRPALLL